LSKQVEILIVGSGIAGLSAGLTAARLGRKTLVLTGDTLGGHLLSIDRIDGFPGFSDGVAGYDLCPGVQEQAIAAGAEVAMARVTAIEFADDAWQVATTTGQYRAWCVILATGTQFRELGVPGESLLRGKGVSQCASCDAPLLRDREVLVAGGGDSALQEALTLAEHCSRVTVVHHGEEISAQAAYRTIAVANSKISFHSESEVTEIIGDAAVTGARVENLRTGASRDFECAGVFVFAGLQPNTAFILDDELLADDGRLLTDGRMRTLRPGLLAAGTVRAACAGRAAAAIGDGMAAALAADEFLLNGSWSADD
jgi:thioredoxin reductase (NADPH)